MHACMVRTDVLAATVNIVMPDGAGGEPILHVIYIVLLGVPTRRSAGCHCEAR